MPPEMLLDSEPECSATAAGGLPLTASRRKMLPWFARRRYVPEMLLSSSPVITQEHFSERCQGWRRLLGEYPVIHHSPHKTGQFPRNCCFCDICFRSCGDADVFPSEPVVGLVSIRNDFRCVSLLPLLQVSRFPPYAGAAVAVGRLCQQPTQMRIAGFGDGKPVAGI